MNTTFKPVVPSFKFLCKAPTSSISDIVCEVEVPKSRHVQEHFFVIFWIHFVRENLNEVSISVSPVFCVCLTLKSFLRNVIWEEVHSVRNVHFSAEHSKNESLFQQVLNLVADRTTPVQHNVDTMVFTVWQVCDSFENIFNNLILCKSVHVQLTSLTSKCMFWSKSSLSHFKFFSHVIDNGFVLRL